MNALHSYYAKLKTLLGLMLISGVLSSCASVVTHPDWEFIRSVGGISIGDLEMIDGNYFLPVKMSVASHKPGTKHEMVCLDTDSRVAGKQIFIKVSTDLKQNHPDASADCPRARLGLIPDGNYRVMYRGPEGKTTKLGDVTADLANAPIGQP